MEMNKYEYPFYKVIIPEILLDIINPFHVFMLLFVGGTIGIIFLPLAYFIKDDLYLISAFIGSISFLSYILGKESNKHYTMRILLRLENKGEINEKNLIE